MEQTPSNIHRLHVDVEGIGGLSAPEVIEPVLEIDAETQLAMDAIKGRIRDPEVFDAWLLRSEGLIGR
jgi:hypothetical protein